MKNEMIYVVELGENAEGTMRSALHATREGAEAKALSWIEADRHIAKSLPSRALASSPSGKVAATGSSSTRKKSKARLDKSPSPWYNTLMTNARDGP